MACWCVARGRRTIIEDSVCSHDAHCVGGVVLSLPLVVSVYRFRPRVPIRLYCNAVTKISRSISGVLKVPADIYIMGTNHPLQCGKADCSDESIATFESELRRLLTEYDIKRVAEEINPDGLKKYKVSETIAQRVVRKLDLDIAYQWVDLSSQERTALSLDNQTLFEALTRSTIQDGGVLLTQAFDSLVDGIRERAWIARILSQEQWPVFFICGSEHSVSVRKLWCSMGFTSEIIYLDYEP